jgi:ribosome biogenesis protein SSF1/2
VESEVSELVDDLRKLMLPYTAIHFKEDAQNSKLTLGKYSQQLAMPMGISHILAFSQNEERVNLRLARVPEGPTMTFRVTQFSLAKHVRHIQKRPYTSQGAFQQPPVVVTNNFGDASAPPHVKLMRITFQNMFPAINVATVKLADCRRVVLFHRMEKDEEGEEEDVVQVRHYAIRATPVGINRKVRRLIQTKVPNLANVQDIADYIAGSANAATDAGHASDSEPEDETSHVVLSQNYAGRGNVKSQKSALKLVEMGPRLSLSLVKVERGLGGGDVMYHAHFTKTAEEVRELKAKKQKETELKQRRRDEQDRNVERKRKAAEEKRETKRQRKEEREKTAMQDLRRGGKDEVEDQDIDIEEEQGESDNEEEEQSESAKEEEEQSGSSHSEDE